MVVFDLDDVSRCDAGSGDFDMLQTLKEKLIENVATLAVAGVVASVLAVWGWARSYVGVEIPVGAVVAFASDECPQDGKWVSFNDANGRTIVGSSNVSSGESGDDGSPIKLHKLYERSGGELIKLKISNLPEFEIPLYYTTTNDEGDKPAAMVRVISPTTGNVSIKLKFAGSGDSMPREMPNIALLYCKKIR
jgi:hypothetical protein